jgi:hypothetical protein
VERKPCYNRARLENLPVTVKRKILIPRSMEATEADCYA